MIGKSDFNLHFHDLVNQEIVAIFQFLHPKSRAKASEIEDSAPGRKNRK